MMLLVLALAAAAPLREAVDWCREPRRLSGEDRAWCDAPPPGCPALVQACAAADAAEAEAGAGCAGRPAAGRGERAARRGRPPEPERAPLHIPLRGCAGLDDVQVPGGAVAGGGAGWALLGVVLLGVVWAILRRARSEEEAEAVAAADAPVVAGEGASAVTGNQGWLEAAERARRSGDLAVALVCARRAVAEALEARGLVSDDPGRTDRELVRAAPEGPVRDELRLLVAVLERVRYAAAPVDAAAVARALQAAARVVAATAPLWLVAPAWAGPADRDVLGPWLEREGAIVARTEFFSDQPAWEVWDGGADVAEADFAAAVAAAERGSRVVVFGAGVLAHTGSLPVTSPGSAHGAFGGVQGMAGRDRWPSMRLPEPPPVLVSQGGWALLVDEEGGVVAVELPLGEGQLVLLPSSSFLDDASLLHPENADTLAAILAFPRGAEVRVVDRVPTPPSALEQVFAAGFGLTFVQLAAVWALWAWASGRTFATRPTWVERPVRELAVHLTAVARFYRATGAVTIAWRAVAARSVHRLRALTRADDAHLVEAVAAQLGEPPDALRPLLSAALRAATSPPPADPLASSERLWNLVHRLQATRSEPSRTPVRR